MFTGIVEAVGSIVSITGLGDGAASIGIDVTALAEVDGQAAPRFRRGDSLAVDGVCLTVTALEGSVVWVDAMRETLERTTLGVARPGRAVNLERAVPAEGRFGGHLVQGHVDTTAEIAARDRHEHYDVVVITLPDRIADYVVSKGAIAVDGVSLTVVDVWEDAFSVGLIPTTIEATTLGRRRVGDLVNLEADVFAKYAERLLARRFGWRAAESAAAEPTAAPVPRPRAASWVRGPGAASPVLDAPAAGAVVGMAEPGEVQP